MRYCEQNRVAPSILQRRGEDVALRFWLSTVVASTTLLGPRQPLPLLLRKLLGTKAVRQLSALDEGGEKGIPWWSLALPPTFSSCMVISLPCSLLLSMRMSRASE